jgi:hypothetical protein
VRLPAPLSVTVQVRALDTGPRLERVWRQTAAIGEAGLLLVRPLPFEPGRPVRVDLVLPGSLLLTATGLVTEVRPDTDDADALPRAITFTALDDATRRTIAAYVEDGLA